MSLATQIDGPAVLLKPESGSANMEIAKHKWESVQRGYVNPDGTPKVIYYSVDDGVIPCHYKAGIFEVDID